MKARLAFVHALSPLHAGTGQGVGVIDLPIAREKHRYPYLPGSSFKVCCGTHVATGVHARKCLGPILRAPSLMRRLWPFVI